MDSSTALMAACSTEDVKQDDVRDAIDNGADVTCVDVRGKSALHRLCLQSPRSAYSHNCIEAAIVVLLRAGCDVNKRCASQRTPLVTMIVANPFYSDSCYVDRARFAVVQALVRGGADLNLSQCDSVALTLFEEAVVAQGHSAVSFIKNYGYTSNLLRYPPSCMSIDRYPSIVWRRIFFARA